MPRQHWSDNLLDRLPRQTLTRLATVGLHAAQMVHELSAPLTIILVRLQLLERAHLDRCDAGLREALAKIRGEADRIEWLLAQIRMFLSEERPLGEIGDAAALADLNAVVREAVGTIKRRHDTGLITFEETYGELPPLRLNTGWLRQALVNVLKNAHEAMGGAGTISIRTARRDPGSVEVSIGDTGPGIDQDRLGRLFTPLHSTKGRNGFGLGLTLCHAVVAAHRGEIEVDSLPGHGTTVRIVLPIDPRGEAA